MKLQGTSKLGHCCSAYMKAKEYESGGLEVEICDYHTHEQQLAHLPLPESTRKMVAAKLNDGVSVSSILDFVRDNVEARLGRKELLSRQDIHNIRQQYNIEGIKLHADDAKSVSLWVQSINNHCSSDNDNPILLFKPQGVEPDEFLKDLNVDDFLICIQTAFQRDMLRAFGSEVVCMDSTHGTNLYGFNLITVLVLDEFGEGIPTAWMICNREDAKALHPFLSKMKEKSGDIPTRIFMSDDANNFYNAWKAVFTVDNTQKLICAWHIDKSWRNGLQKHISTISKQADVYHHLRVLLAERDITSFRQRLQQFISWLSDSDELSCFLQYFQKEYVKKAEQWAPCYRVNCAVNTNMALEAFHRVIKVCYLEKKQNRRIDYLLHLLLKVARDKVFERFFKTQKGKSSHRLCEINKRHKAAEKMSPSDTLLSSSDGIWKIKAASLQQTHYMVGKKLDNCSCKLRCSSCDVCIHSYSCTCMDFLIHSTVCKHIHLVKMFSESQFDNAQDNDKQLKPKSSYDGEQVNTEVIDYEPYSANQPSSSQADFDESHGQTEEFTLQEGTNSSETTDETPVKDTSSLNYLSSQVHTKTTSELNTLKEKTITACKKIEVALGGTTNLDIIKATHKHLNAALTIINARHITNDTFTARKRSAPNSNSEQQVRFHSTKKKREQKARVSKPSEEELVSCQGDLEKVEIKVCGLCLFETDNQDGDDVDWIQCDTCSMWFHLSCVEVHITTEKFYCKFCLSTQVNVAM